MSTQAGAGPFVLIYHKDQAEYLREPDASPSTAHFWPRDRPLPDGWEVCPLVHLYAPVLDAKEPELTVEQIASDAEEQVEETRLGGEADRKDLAFKLVEKLEGAVSSGFRTTTKEALELARELYRALPGGE